MKKKDPDKKTKILECHAKTIKESLEELKSGREGLDGREVEKRQEEYGKNKLPGKKPLSIWSVILSQFKSPLIYILIIAGIISGAVGEVKDSIFIFFIILLNSALGTFQEWRAEKSARTLQDYIKVFSEVLRNGQKIKVNAEELVPGDIVLLQSGFIVPADLRLIKTKNLTIDESILTGESNPADKNILKLDEDTIINDCSNLAFAGTRISTGRGTGVVTKTGLATEIGKIAQSVYASRDVKPPLLVRIDRFARQIGYVVIGTAALLAVIAILRGFAYLDVFLLSIALAVSAIPEGLPVAVTVALSISTNRMAKRNVIVRKLAAVESLGSCTVIASDKTGTLTLNKQTAKIIITGPGRKFVITGEGYNDKGDILPEAGGSLDDRERDRVARLAKAVAIDNEARLYRKGSHWHSRGNPIELALLSSSYKIGLDPDEVREASPIAGEIPFDSEYKFSAKLYEENKSVMIAAKGAPEVIIPMCSKINTSEGTGNINRKEIERESKELSRSGYRVLAIAGGKINRKKTFDDFKKEDMHGLTFLGLVGFMDPLRPEAREAVQMAGDAGVRVVMVTGDNPETALFIAKELEIASSTDDVATGNDLDRLKPGSEKFKNKVRSSSVFARVTPLQKLNIVEALKEIGNSVAVTGDGINDTPALKRANIGVAMGSGTDVTKDTASIIVTDNSLSSIVTGIEEGRFAYDNIRKVTYLLISTGAAEVLLFTGALLAGLPVALLAIQLLWLNLVTNGIQDIALAFEKGEPGVMKRHPREPGEGIFNRLMIQQTLVSGFFMGALTLGAWFYLINSGWEVAEARNILLLLMVLLQNLHVFNCRSERESAFKIPISRNYILIFGIIAAQGLHMISLYIPFMQDLLGTSPVRFTNWIILLLIACSIIAVMEIFKAIKKRWPVDNRL